MTLILFCAVGALFVAVCALFVMVIRFNERELNMQYQINTLRTTVHRIETNDTAKNLAHTHK